MKVTRRRPGCGGLLMSHPLYFFRDSAWQARCRVASSYLCRDRQGLPCGMGTWQWCGGTKASLLLSMQRIRAFDWHCTSTALAYAGQTAEGYLTHGNRCLEHNPETGPASSRDSRMRQQARPPTIPHSANCRSSPARTRPRDKPCNSFRTAARVIAGCTWRRPPHPTTSVGDGGDDGERTSAFNGPATDELPGLVWGEPRRGEESPAPRAWQWRPERRNSVAARQGRAEQARDPSWHRGTGWAQRDDRMDEWISGKVGRARHSALCDGDLGAS